MTIDAHTHFHSRTLEGKAGKLGPKFHESSDGKTYWQIGNRRQAAPRPIYDIEFRLRKMDEAEVDCHILSNSPKWFLYNFIHDADPTACVEFAQAQNDDLLSAVRAHPGRFQALATLPLLDMRASLEELGRASDLGAKGIILDSTIGGKGLDDEGLFPLYEKLQELGLPIFVHPSFLPDQRINVNGLRWPIGFCFDETYALTCLILGGVLDQFTRLKIVISHGGGALPYLRDRLQAATHRADVRVKCTQPFDCYLKRIYFDACLYHPDPLKFLVETVGTSNVLFGTNYPGSPDMRPTIIQQLTNISAENKQDLSQENAKSVYDLK